MGRDFRVHIRRLLYHGNGARYENCSLRKEPPRFGMARYRPFNLRDTSHGTTLPARLSTFRRGCVLKFFVPDQSPEHAEDVYNDFREIFNAADKRIRSVTIPMVGTTQDVQLCVGQAEPWYGGKIVLILLSYPQFYIFTRERGIDSGSPITVPTKDARVEEFDLFDRPDRLGRGA